MVFLDPNEIPEDCQLVKDKVLPEEAAGVAKWFDKYYVSGMYLRNNANSTKLTIKRKPLFPPAMWSVFDRTYEIPKTQNVLESWHQRWTTLLNRKKWNVFKTIKEFSKEVKYTEYEIERIRASEPMPKRRRSPQIQYENRMQKHLSQNSEMDLLAFLGGLAHILHLIN